jgi:hypothetical protein
MCCSSFAPIWVVCHESPDISGRDLGYVDLLAAEVLTQEVTGDSATLISRTVGKTANVLEVFGESADLLLQCVRYRPQKPRYRGSAQYDEKMSKCSANF